MIVNSTRACIEILESRRLLSAVPASYAPAALVEGAAATHTHPTIRSVVGTFVGTFSTTAGPGTLTLTISSQSKSGKFIGTEVAALSGSPADTFSVKGSINVKGKFTVHGSAGHHSFSATGSLSADGKTIAGKFVFTTRHGSSRGTFEVSTT